MNAVSALSFFLCFSLSPNWGGSLTNSHMTESGEEQHKWKDKMCGEDRGSEEASFAVSPLLPLSLQCSSVILYCLFMCFLGYYCLLYCWNTLDHIPLFHVFSPDPPFFSPSHHWLQIPSIREEWARIKKQQKGRHWAPFTLHFAWVYSLSPSAGLFLLMP